MSQLSTAELIRVITEDADDYTKEALEIARGELSRRGGAIPTSMVRHTSEKGGDGFDDASPEEIANAYKDRDKQCRDCGGNLRYAALQSQNEVFLTFLDTHELRFLEVDVCVRCRKVTLRADLETEV